MAQRQIAFILHGQHCHRNFPARLHAVFGDEFPLHFHPTTSEAGAAEAAYLALRQGCDYLIAAGGDGTVHEMVNGAMRLAPEDRERITLGLIPHGTGNDFARELGLTNSIEQLSRLIRTQQSRVLDLGRMQLRTTGGETLIQYFATIASLGISASVVERVKASPSWMPAALAFSWGTVRALAAMRPRRMRFRTDSGEAFSGEFVEVCLANGRFFGGGLGIAPTALLDDGLLNLVMIRGASSRVFLRFLPALRRAKPIHDARIEYRCCRSVEIEALPQDTCLVADGELLDSVPCVIDVVPRALRWLCD